MSVGIHNLPEMTRSKIFGSYLASGDSLTVGLYATASYGFSYMTAANLQAAGHAASFNIQAITGAGIDDNIANLPAELLAHDPDIMTVEIGINNLGTLTAPVFQAKYKQVLDLLVGHRADMLVVCCTVPWTGQSAVADSYRVALEFNAAIRAEAGARGFPVAETWEATVLHYEYLSGIDSFHPNDAGHTALASAVWAVMQPALSTWGF